MDTYEKNRLQAQISVLQIKVKHLEIATAKTLSDYDLQDIHRRISAQEARALNADVDKQQDTAMREAAARAQADPDFVSRRSNVASIHEMGAFIRRLIDPDDLGYAVTAEVRQLARKALDMPKAPE